MSIGGGAKFAESGKKMVMAGFSAGDELAHGKRIQQVSVKSGILQRYAGRWLVIAGIARRLRERKIASINTYAVVHGVGDETFRVNRSREMIVEVAAFR